MQVRFKSDSVLSGRGLKAHVSYKPRGLGTWMFCSTINLCQIDEGNCGHDMSFKKTYIFSADYECSGGLKCGHDNCPNQLELDDWVDCCYQPKWKRCQDSLNLDKGILSSPYYPNYYEPYQECSWLISVPDNFTIILNFTSSLSVIMILTFPYHSAKHSKHFQLNSYTNIRCYDGNSSDNEIIAEIKHDEQVNSVGSNMNEMFVTFSSDVNVETGFVVEILQKPIQDKDPNAFCTVTNPCTVNEGHCFHDKQCSLGLKCGQRNCLTKLGYAVDTNCCYEHCNQWLDLSKGILTSPNYPNNYPHKTECAWLISAEENQQIELHFQEFEVCTNVSTFG